ncbi:MAG: hypothetical protein H7274_26000, partial [Rhodoferax sp.]|nr:hypothetical protein [Rhodoferax sp.]
MLEKTSRQTLSQNVIDAPGLSMADALNHGCLCLTLDASRLKEQLEHDPSLSGLYSGLAQSHPHLFSRNAVFLSSATYSAIAQTVVAIERVMALPAYQARALENAQAIAQRAFGPVGAFMGYDFHVDAGNPGFKGPQLIEINTNAGGALLNAALARAHRACCEPMGLVMNTIAPVAALEDTFFEMFRSEWRLQRGNAVWRTVAIVDDAPHAQYLAPEFELC